MSANTVSETKALEIFSYKGQQVRTVEHNGEVWFVAKDVCDVLEIKNANDTVQKMLDDDEKGIEKVYTPGGNQNMTVISESGCYGLILRSNKPEAKNFARWVRKEVLPQIRRHGAYVPDSALRNPEFIKQLAARLDAIEAENKELRERIDKDMACTTLGKIFVSSPKALSVQTAAQVLAQHGFEIGQNRLFKRFRDKKLLCSRKGKQYNKPTQKAIEQGFLGLQASGNGVAVVVMPKYMAKLADELTQEYMPVVYLIDRTEAIQAIEA